MARSREMSETQVKQSSVSYKRKDKAHMKPIKKEAETIRNTSWSAGHAAMGGGGGCYAWKCLYSTPFLLWQGALKGQGSFSNHHTSLQEEEDRETQKELRGKGALFGASPPLMKLYKKVELSESATLPIES